MRVVGLTRVSSAQQAESGLGIAAQRAAIAAHCAENGFELVAFFSDEGVSGSAPLDKRPGLIGALNAISEKRAEAVVVNDLSRLSRDTFIQLTVERALKTAGARLVSVKGEGTEDDSASSLLVRRIMSAVHEHALSLHSARSKAAQQQARERGSYIGRPPFGLCVIDGRLERSPDWDEAIRGIEYRKTHTLHETAEFMGWSYKKAWRITNRFPSTSAMALFLETNGQSGHGLTTP